MNTHLSERAILRWHADETSQVERRHVAECAECQARVKPLADALSWFSAAARQWGTEKAALAQEWRAAKASVIQEWEESRFAAARRWRSMIAVWAVVSVALLMIFGIGLPRWKAHRAVIEAQMLQHRQEQAKQELARDNALLDQVDQDVSQEVPAALQPLSWSTSDTATRQ
jgi:hypothetical protein